MESAPSIDALQAMRGIALITAVVLVAEVGDFHALQTRSEHLDPAGAPDEASEIPRHRLALIVLTWSALVARLRGPAFAPSRAS